MLCHLGGTLETSGRCYHPGSRHHHLLSTLESTGTIQVSLSSCPPYLCPVSCPPPVPQSPWELTGGMDKMEVWKRNVLSWEGVSQPLSPTKEERETCTTLMQNGVCLSKISGKIRIIIPGTSCGGAGRNSGQSVTLRAFELSRQMALGKGSCRAARVRSLACFSGGRQATEGKW